MARHRRYLGNNVGSTAGARSSIGDAYVEEAVTKLNSACQNTVVVMTGYPHTREATLPMLFDDGVIDRMHAVRGLVVAASSIKFYEIKPDINLHIDYTEARLPAIQASALNFNYDRITPLLEHIDAVKAVHDRFEEVKGVLRYCNRNCTPGAIRYNFPQAIALCPTAPALRDLGGVPTRHTNPADIGDWIQAIKDATATLAQVAMLPDGLVPRDKGRMWLTFSKKKVHVGASSSYETDLMTYNL